MQKVRIESIGLHLPEEIVSTRDLMGRMKNIPGFDLEKITGIRNRRVKQQTDDSHSIAVDAAHNCLKKSRYAAHELEVVICTSITRFMGGEITRLEPSFSLAIKNSLGAHDAINFDIANACAGMNNGVLLLQKLIQAGIVKNGMVVSGECLSSITETALKEIDNPFSNQFASLTVGDSGAAVILDTAPGGDEGIDFVEFTTLSEHALECLGLPSDKNTGVAMYSNSRKLSSMELVQYLPRFVDDTLARYGLTIDDYDYIIPHQTAVTVIKKHLGAIRDYFNIENMPRDLNSVEEFGNTSTTTHYVVLADCLERNLIEKGARVLMMTTASGVVIGLTSLII